MTDSRWKNLALEVIGCFVSALGLYSFAVAAGVPVTGVAGIGAHEHHDVLDRVDRAQRGLERGLQRHAQHAQFDVGDLHGVARGRILWMFVMRST